MKQQIFLILLLQIGITFLNYANETGENENQHLDSLLIVYQGMNDDSNKVIILNEISWHYIVISADSGIDFGLRALNLASEIEWEKGRANACNNIGEAYRFKGNISVRLNFMKKH